MASHGNILRISRGRICDHYRSCYHLTADYADSSLIFVSLSRYYRVPGPCLATPTKALGNRILERSPVRRSASNSWRSQDRRSRS